MIAPVELIPEYHGKPTYKGQLRADLRNAWEQGVERFEFLGYGDCKYLASYARDARDTEFNTMIRKDILRMVREQLPEEDRKDAHIYVPYLGPREICRITSRMIDGQVHVYCEFLAMGEKYREWLQEHADSCLQRIARRKAEKEVK